MKLEDIKCVGVVGGGAMGGGISQALILGGYKVICRELTDEKVKKTRDEIVNGRFGLKGGVERGRQTQEQMDQALANLTLTTKVEDLKNCDLIIEAVGHTSLGGLGEEALENKPLKIRVFAELDKIIKKDAIFVSNTTRFTIADLNKEVNPERKKRFMGMHWYRPANIMRLVELIYTKDTPEELIVVMEALCKRLGKTGIRVKDVPGDPGFIGTRVYGACSREAQKVVDEGIATAEDVNAAMMMGFNWPVGPLTIPGAARGF